MTCPGICSRYKAETPALKKGVGRFESGQKLCRACGVYLNWDGMKCPCCGRKLSGKPRSRESKERLLTVEVIS